MRRSGKPCGQEKIALQGVDAGLLAALDDLDQASL